MRLNYAKAKTLLRTFSVTNQIYLLVRYIHLRQRNVSIPPRVPFVLQSFPGRQPSSQPSSKGPRQKMRLALRNTMHKFTVYFIDKLHNMYSSQSLTLKPCDWMVWVFYNYMNILLDRRKDQVMGKLHFQKHSNITCSFAISPARPFWTSSNRRLALKNKMINIVMYISNCIFVRE